MRKEKLKRQKQKLPRVKTKMKMKTNLRYSTEKLILTIVAIIFFFFQSYAQGKDSVMDKSEATIQLSFLKKSDLSKAVIAKVLTKNTAGKLVPAKNTRVNFYIKNKQEQLFLKSVLTDKTGDTYLELPTDLPLDTARYFNLVAKIENDKLYADAAEILRYKDANISIKLNPHDTAKLVTVSVTETGSDGKEKPVKDVPVRFYVQRLFGNVPATEDPVVSTDESGETSIVYPKGIPGDSVGNIIVVARIEDNEFYGNIENKATAQWGMPLIPEKDPFPRALWEPYAPFSLIIVITVLFGGVWMIYFFLFYQLYKIKKGEKLKTAEVVKVV